MLRDKKLFVVVLTLLLSVPAGVIASQKDVKLDEKIARIEAGLLGAIQIKGQPLAPMKLSDRMCYYKVPGVSIAVIKDLGIEWAKGYGFKASGKNDPVLAETIFQAASTSKPVAALAALRLVQDGALNLDENVNAKLLSWKVLDNSFTAEKKVTLRELLSHSAGLTVHGFRGYALRERVPTLKQILDGEKPSNSAAIRVDILPGSQFRYSGGGFTVMQQLLMDVEKKPFPMIMDELVLRPVGMSQSTYIQPLPESRWGTEALAHGPDGLPLKGKWHTYPEMAAAGLWTTPSDLARFAIVLAQAWLGKSDKIISQETAKKMLTRQLAPWGLGLQLRGEGESFAFEHGGSNEGYRCNFVLYPVKGVGLAVMTNGDNGSDLISEIQRSVGREYGIPDLLPKVKEVKAIDPKVLELYAGKYQFTPDFVLVFTNENGRLFVAPPGQLKFGLLPESETKFFGQDNGVEVTFVKDKNGRFDEVQVLLNFGGGDPFHGKRVKQ
jgi:CubicO group peptidase (beta-lactamase class C family)